MRYTLRSGNSREETVTRRAWSFGDSFFREPYSYHRLLHTASFYSKCVGITSNLIESVWMRYWDNNPVNWWFFGQNVHCFLQVSGSEQEKRRKKLEKERKITLSVAVVVGVFILCWGPLNVMLIVYCVCHSCVSSLAIEAAEVFSMLNSGCNPLIYGTFNKDFRRTFKAMIQCRWRQINREEIEGSTQVAMRASKDSVEIAKWKLSDTTNRSRFTTIFISITEDDF